MVRHSDRLDPWVQNLGLASPAALSELLENSAEARDPASIPSGVAVLRLADDHRLRELRHFFKRSRDAVADDADELDWLLRH